MISGGTLKDFNVIFVRMNKLPHFRSIYITNVVYLQETVLELFILSLNALVAICPSIQLP